MSSHSASSKSSTGHRRLVDGEKRVLSTLLSAEFPGCAELSEQVGLASVRTIDTNGSLEFVLGGGAPAPVVRRIPVEAEFEDSDGMTVHVLLHVVDGLLNELEIYREDSGPVQGGLVPDKFRLIVL